MRFLLKLIAVSRNTEIPVNYQYPLSAAIYKILNRADEKYSAFLHERGYGKGFKLFTFSQLQGPFQIHRDRLTFLEPEVQLHVAFHLPDAAENFIKGLFASQEMEIADRVSRGRFTVRSVETVKSPFVSTGASEIISVDVVPISPVVAGLKNEKGNYDFLSPDDERFPEVIRYNWREKIRTCFDNESADGAMLLAEVMLFERPPKSRLMTIKAGTTEETKIRGWMNFGLRLTAERRFLEVVMDSGVGIYNSLGCGMVGYDG